MLIYKIIIVALVLTSCTLVACSTDELETTSTTTVQPTVQQDEQQATTESHGLSAYIDPKTGQFLDKPPLPDPKTPAVDNSVVGQKKIQTPVYSDLKEATVEGGGSYIEVIKPSKQQRDFTKRSK